MKRCNHKLNGVTYTVELLGCRLDGVCTSPDAPEKNIIVMARQHTQNELMTVIHEALHASKWSLSEDDVERIALDIGGLLWKLGYRRKKGAE